MAYEKQTWVDGVTPLNAEHLNHMEEGIGSCVQAVELEEAVQSALTQAKESGEFDGADGQKGADGKNGADGVSVTHSWNGTTLTVTSASGTSSANLKGDAGAAGKDGSNGKTPVKGTDYYTESDKAEIVMAVRAALTNETWTFTLSDGSTVTKRVYVS